MLIEGRHFTNKQDLYSVGYKAMACSLSDIAAMGGEPGFALLSLGVPRRFKFKDMVRLSQGIKKAAQKFYVDIIGGDTNASDKLVIDICMAGFVQKENLVLRSGAKEGDYIFVTGGLGGSIYGRHLKFIPRVKESQFLVSRFKLNSMIDISDGLVLDLWRILKLSRVSAIIFENLLPRHKDAKNMKEVLYMGEDFELLFSVGAKEGEKLLNLIEARHYYNGGQRLSANVLMADTSRKPRALARRDSFRNNKVSFPVSFIGKIIKGNSKISMVNKDNKLVRLKPKGFLHF
jgi:thiamine-monophosphate kinase